MGVMLQAFYWDCPQAENREHQWWIFIKSKLPLIAQARFTALWLPPANKAAGWKSMGYDPYDSTILVRRRKNGPTRPAGSISGRLRADMQCMCRRNP